MLALALSLLLTGCEHFTVPTDPFNECDHPQLPDPPYDDLDNSILLQDQSDVIDKCRALLGHEVKSDYVG